MLEPISAAGSLKFLWPELALIVGWLLVRMIEDAPDVSFLTAPRAAAAVALMALVTSFGIPFEAAALAGDLLHSDPPAVLAIRVVLATTTLALLLGASTDLLILALAASLASRASDTLMMVVILQFLLVAGVLVSLRSPARLLPGWVAPAREDLLGPTLGVALVAAGAALLLGATTQTAFGSLGVALAHRDTLGGWTLLATLVPVAVVARRIGEAPHAALRSTGGVVDPTGAAALVLVTIGLLVLLWRWVGVALGGDTGTAATGAVTALPWRALLAFFAIVPMTRGTLTALTADRTTTLAAGLVEAQVGWLLAGAASGTMVGASASCLALIIAIPSFLALASLKGGPDRVVSGFAGAPAAKAASGAEGIGIARLATAVLLLSLAAAPGTAGFAGRWELALATRQGASWWLLLPGLLLWVIGLVAVLRWMMTPSLRRDAALAPVGILLALPALAGALIGPTLRGLLSDVFPFP